MIFTWHPSRYVINLRRQGMSDVLFGGKLGIQGIPGTALCSAGHEVYCRDCDGGPEYHISRFLVSSYLRSAAYKHMIQRVNIYSCVWCILRWQYTLCEAGFVDIVRFFCRTCQLHSSCLYRPYNLHSTIPIHERTVLPPSNVANRTIKTNQPEPSGSPPSTFFIHDLR